jgi:hypothetical protein
MALSKVELATLVQDQKLLSILEMAVWFTTDTSEVNYRNLESVCALENTFVMVVFPNP